MKIGAMRRHSTLPSRSGPTWIMAVARNRALDEARKRKPATLDPESEGLHLASPEPDPLAGRDRSEELRRLLGCLDRLDADRAGGSSCSPIARA